MKGYPIVEVLRNLFFVGRTELSLLRYLKDYDFPTFGSSVLAVYLYNTINKNLKKREGGVFFCSDWKVNFKIDRRIHLVRMLEKTILIPLSTDNRTRRQIDKWISFFKDLPPQVPLYGSE